MLGERMHHAHLNGAEAAAAGKHKGGYRRPGMARYGQSVVGSLLVASTSPSRDFSQNFIAADAPPAPSTKVGRPREASDDESRSSTRSSPPSTRAARGGKR